MSDRRPDITKMRETYGWEPSVPLRTGLGMMVEDFRRRLGVGGGAMKKAVSAPSQPTALPHIRVAQVCARGTVQCWLVPRWIVGAAGRDAPGPPKHMRYTCTSVQCESESKQRAN
jgi:hypothetical protein